jgi:hypothetical protein
VSTSKHSSSSEGESDSIESYPESDPTSDRVAQVSGREPSSETEEVGVVTGVARCWVGLAEKLEQCWMRRLSWDTVILSAGLLSKIMPRMSFNSSDSGRIVFRKPRFLAKAR